MPTLEALNPDVPLFARTGINLASAGLGAQAESASDQFFAPAQRMLDDAEPVFIAGKFDDNGKWMDGWETRRRRGGGHDHCVIRLATAGQLLGFDLDTRYFTGNYAPAARIEAAHAPGGLTDRTEWVEVLRHRSLGPSAHHFFPCQTPESWTHIRLHIYPDGGVARLRVYGVPKLEAPERGPRLDLVAALNGGRILAFSDAHFGDYTRLLAPGRSKSMAEGWETRRRREPGYDWMVLALGVRGSIDEAVLDTAFFKGNYPDRCSIQAADLRILGDGLADALVTDAMFWQTLLPEQVMRADREQSFVAELNALGPVTHVRLNMLPDGGISRLRLFGRPA